MNYPKSYIDKGWLPIAMHAGEKKPVYKWAHLADLRPPYGPEFLQPWLRNPNHGVSILMKPSGLLVVDCDSEAAVREAISLTDERCNNIVLSRNGVHMYYRLPDGTPPMRRVQQGACGKIDIMADGYMVAPPSVHPSGHRYQWVSQGPLQDAPEWACKLLREVKVRSIERTCLKPDDVLSAFPSNEEEMFALQTALKAVNPNLYAILAGTTQPVDRSRSLWLLTNTLMRLRIRMKGGKVVKLGDESIAKVIWFGTLGQKPRERGWQWLCDELARARLELGSA